MAHSIEKCGSSIQKMGDLMDGCVSVFEGLSPGWMRVSVRAVLWRTGHGAVEVCSAEETHSDLLPTSRGSGVLQG